MPVQGKEPFKEDLEWLKFGRETVRQSPDVLDEAAKSFLALGSSLLTVYTGALALFKLTERVSGLFSWAMISIPIVLWLFCISCLAYVYSPNRIEFDPNSPSDIERVTREVSRKKSLRLKIGSVLFVAALAAASISIVWLGAQPAKETQRETAYLVLTEDKADMLKNLSGPIPVILTSENRTFSRAVTPGDDAGTDTGQTRNKS